MVVTKNDHPNQTADQDRDRALLHLIIKSEEGMLVQVQTAHGAQNLSMIDVTAHDQVGVAGEVKVVVKVKRIPETLLGRVRRRDVAEETRTRSFRCIMKSPKLMKN